MIPINRTYAPIQALVDELARCGMRHAVTCPGSRNAPIALTLAADERIDAVSVIDERAGGFLALGMAKASGLPVAVTCTSGSAGANLAPAVVEAWEARVPLIVLTADRPPELRDVGAGQAIDQLKLYGSAAKWFVEVGNHDPGRESAVHHRSLACRAWHTALAGRPGPVHLNVPLREPLAPAAEEMDDAEWAGRPDGRPWTERRAPARAPAAGDVQDLAARLAAAPRAAVVCGPTGEHVADAVARLCEQGGWPALAEPASGVRCGEHDRSRVIAGYDALLRDSGFADSHVPDLVLRVGDTPTSKSLRGWLARAPQVVLDPHSAWHEPTRLAELLLDCDAAPACAALAAALEMRGVERDAAWLSSWLEADTLVQPALSGAADPFEPKLVAGLEPVLPDGGIVWAASSMPVRHLETFFPSSPRPIRFLANRGANGIDGTLASAAGAAHATGAPTTVVLGDLALLHDLDGLLAVARAGIELTIVCLDNGGGGIFDFLPVAEHAERDDYERHVATPGGLDLASVAALARVEHRLARTVEELRTAHRAGPGLIEVPTDRATNVREQRAVLERVASSLRGVG